MANMIIPLTPNNQTFTCTLPVDNKNLTLGFTIRYNEPGGYWFMSVTDVKSNTLLLDAVPLVTGQYPATNLLEQYGYLGIGSAFVIPTTSFATDIPDDTNLGSDYVLVWGDTIGN